MLRNYYKQISQNTITFPKRKEQISIEKSINNAKQIPISGKLKVISIHMVNQCLFKCKHCFLWVNKYPFESVLSLEKILLFLKDIKKLYGTNVRIELGGDGMISLSENLYPVLKTSSDLGFHTVITTNGYLINQVILKKMVNNGLKSIVVSLDYLTAEKHDKQRGVNGSYKHVLNLINYCNKYNELSLVVSFIIMSSNSAEIIPLTKELIKDKRVNRISFNAIAHPLSHSPYNKKWYLTKKFKNLWPDNILKIIKVIDELSILKKKNPKINVPTSQLSFYKYYFLHPDKYYEKNNCNIEYLGYEISIEGHVLICNNKKSIGSLAEKRLPEMIKENYSELAKDINKCTINCHQIMNCTFRSE